MTKLKPTPIAWMTENKPSVEPFSDKKEQKTNIKLVDFNGYYVVSPTKSTKKEYKNFLVRLDVKSLPDIENSTGSMNSIINALIEYAINDLKEKNKTIIVNK